MTPAKTGNLLQDIPGDMPEEIFASLGGGPSTTQDVRVDRIVSRGQASPEGYWYDQDEDEFILVVQGAAKLTLNENGQHRHIEMSAMDWAFLPAHMRHRVDWTTPDENTVWLAVYY